MGKVIAGEELLMRIVGFSLAACFVWLVGRKYFRGRGIGLTRSQEWPAIETLRWAVKNPEIRRRSLCTIGVLIAIQFASLIPLPGINSEALKSFFNGILHLAGEFQVLQIPAFWKGTMGILTIFGLGLAPFFSSCLLIQLGSAFIPHLRRLSFGGESGRRAIEQYSYALTVLLALVQSFFISVWLENPRSTWGNVEIVWMTGPVFRLLTMATMTAGTLMLLAACNAISKHGLGNGIALIVAVAILSELCAASRQLFLLHGNIEVVTLVILAVIFCAFVSAAFYMTSREISIKLSDEHHAQAISLPMRPSWIATQPVDWAASLLLLPATLAGFKGGPVKGLPSAILGIGWLRFLLGAIFIFGISHLYGWIVFRPRYVNELAVRYGFVGSTNIEQLLKNERKGLLLVTSLFLLVILQLPVFIQRSFQLPYFVAHIFGGVGVVVLVGVFLDLVKQLEFFRRKSESGIKDWAVCYTAFDEIEATIKSGYLERSGVPALVEPLRFTWGIPIRTAVDQYRIYAPSDKAAEARNLLSREGR